MITFIHGWLANASVWNPIRAYTDPRARTEAYDLPGAGTRRGFPGPYDIAGFAADLVRRLREDHQEKTILVGHSAGALIALHAALDAPALVEGLLLLAPVPADGFTFSPRVEAFMRELPTHPEQRRTWLRTLTAHPLSEEQLRFLEEAAASMPPHVAQAFYTAWTQARFAERLVEIHTPTLIIAPEQDRPITPTIIQSRIAAFLPRARMEVLKDAGHYAQFDQPCALGAMILHFARTFPGLSLGVDER